MASETHDLLVRIREEGADETAEAVGGVGDEFGDTADETERTAGIVGEMSGRLRGFAGIIVGTLTTLAAGILTQVPVIQESASALGAVIDAIALRIDERLRPSMNRLNRDLFDLADAINRGEGTLDALINTLLSFQDAATGIPFSGLATDVIGFATSLGEDLGSGLTTAIDAISDFISDVRFGWDVFWSSLSNRVKIGANDILSDVESFVNDAIRALNRLPNVNLSTVSLGRFETRTREEIVGAARARQAAREGRLAPAGGGRAGGVNSSQIERIIAALQNSRQETTLQLDSETVARNVGPLLGEGAANAGATQVNR